MFGFYYDPQAHKTGALSLAKMKKGEKRKEREVKKEEEGGKVKLEEAPEINKLEAKGSEIGGAYWRRLLEAEKNTLEAEALRQKAYKTGALSLAKMKEEKRKEREVKREEEAKKTQNWCFTHFTHLAKMKKGEEEAKKKEEGGKALRQKAKEDSSDYFYHFTDDDGARNIIRSGKIQASLKLSATGRAGHGNGVYLTKLKPEDHTRSEIALNNWGRISASFINKTENYFVLLLPDSDIKDAAVKDRDIFLFGRRNDLPLVKYKWWLMNYDSKKIIASYKYQLSSVGPVSLLPLLNSKMGEYRMSEEIVNGRPVYKHEGFNLYLFMSSHGSWIVGPDAGEDKGWFSQLQESSKYSLGPVLNVLWKYGNQNQSVGQRRWNTDDATLWAYPCKK